MSMVKLIRKFKGLNNTIWNNIIFKYKHVKYGERLKINGRVYVYGDGEVFLSDGVILTSDTRTNPISEANRIVFYTKKNAVIKIGEKSGLTNSIIIAHEKVEIEDNVLIGANCKFYDTDFHSLSYEERVDGDSDTIVSPILVKSGAFIGAHSIILKGVTIGENSIIGAGSVVAKNIPDGEIWAGNPVEFIRKI